ncbi:Dirigent protein 11 [Sesamum alatum]|uniref:Dirigent protein n=1 Tax=Sesamum alatum TaxID=300844 RepID=A0AAE2CX33_9LAMI|nr:Dirigent protein 11 [Sesamum alatum]
MAKLICLMLIVISSLSMALPSCYARKTGPPAPDSTEELWVQKISNDGKQTDLMIRFYVQDLLAGENKTVYEVATASITADSPTDFGQVRVLDDLVTAEPDYYSTPVARAQGLITYADLRVAALAMNMNFVFTTGFLSGSTICILGRNQIDLPEREVAVVGGTGYFRNAGGYAITKTYSYDAEKEYGVLEYTLYVTVPTWPSMAAGGLHADV